MCGIAGYSLGPASTVGRTLAAQALLAGIAERGADAVGYAHREGGGAATVSKLRGGASALLDEIAVPATASSVLIHVRDFTKGHPDIEANNHPIRHGSVVGVHNGVLSNDDELLDRYGIERHEPGMTVDSEAIFALMELRGNDARALSELRGSMAAGWVDEREPDAVFLARGTSRPLWIGRTRTEVFFASTQRALTIVEAALRLRLETEQLRQGRLIEARAGQIARKRRFRADRRYRETASVSPVQSPHEAVSCLSRLAALASV
ncbi:MAG: class II glutamine amidotransferase [Gaiellaceae bacterium]